MKYIVILGDGMADWQCDRLGGKTPLEAAHKPYMDMLCENGETGLVKTVPNDLPPGSDVANLSVMGYNPHIYYTGRSPLEAVSMGVNVADSDTTFRTNLVTLSDDEPYENKTMVDYSSGEITTAESRELMKFVNEKLGDGVTEFFGGISYRHLLLWHGLNQSFRLTPPHDISGKKTADYLPDSPKLLELMKASYRILKDHPINLDRQKRGLNPANSIWIWGQGKRPTLKPFFEKYGKSGAVISAVDLVKGIGICTGMKSIDVPGVTGNIDTNFDGKAQAAIDALTQCDFVYVHMEAPDECGHRFEAENKVKSIELIDEKVIKPIYNAMTALGEDFSIMVLPDHPTPLKIGTHTNDPVPFIIYRSNSEIKSGLKYDENSAKNGCYIEKGYTLMDKFLS